MSVYSDIHRSLLQYVMSKGSVTVDNTLKFFRKLHAIADEDVNEMDLEGHIQIINEKLEKYHQQIRRTTCEMTGSNFYVFINTIINEVNKLQCVFKEKDADFIRLLLDEILNSEQYTVSLTSTSNLVPKINGYTIQKSEKVIQQLITVGYIYEQNENLSLGARSICELEPYFREFYSKLLNECILCKGLVFCGKKCEKCNELLHSHCIEHYLSRRVKCPSCKNDWSAKKLRTD